MKKILALVLVLALSLGYLGALAEEVNWRALEGGELMVYVGSDEEHGAAVVKAFEEKTGIKTRYIRISGNDAYTRILEERENPQADIWYGGTWDPYIAAANEGLLYAYKGHQARALQIPPTTALATQLFGIYSATSASLRHGSAGEAGV